MSGFVFSLYLISKPLFGLLLFALWARVFLRYFKVSSLHPVSKSLNTYLDPLVKPFNSFFAAKSKRFPAYDFAALAVIFLVEIIKFIFIGFLIFKKLIPISYILIFSFLDMVREPCNLLFYLILIRVIMSWVNPQWQTPVAEVIKKITDPILSFSRQLIPEISGIDISPYAVMLFLKIIVILIGSTFVF